ncbi:hypothetical protein O181_012743 [Austropuccinia psidii MF-1]|uniref:Glutamyl-tRNA(Gln) amidotransferase subunit B, mitochondrial n=1 Tax=Austropuccinia psidii MF-1 TaxID=1389203 RepID=A0A9Q3BXC2_9BASI|nr:hypothetical protein [Austropuccinia psidii MF-1]
MSLAGAVAVVKADEHEYLGTSNRSPPSFCGHQPFLEAVASHHSAEGTILSIQYFLRQRLSADFSLTTAALPPSPTASMISGRLAWARLRPSSFVCPRTLNTLLFKRPNGLGSLSASASTSHRFGRQSSSSAQDSWTASSDAHPLLQPVIGLELHVQLASNAKLFSSAEAPSSDQNSNTNVALFDAATPGTQPILSPDCLRLALIASLALECKINHTIGFDRKHYFYPDLPAGYQITQHYAPLAKNGNVIVTPHDGADRTFQVGIIQLQLEQDTAKSYTDPLSPDQILVDLNRSGAALIEIVTQPDLRSAKDASSFVRKIQSILKFAGVTKGNMEEGSLRCDVNVSVGLPGTTTQGARCEIKNINGFSHIEQAIAFEISRQTTLLANGRTIETETRGYDVARRQTFRLRDKETKNDYRYFPDPDLPQLRIPLTVVERLRALLPELPHSMIERLQARYGLTRQTAEILILLGFEKTDNMVEIGCGVRYFEAVMQASNVGIDGQVLANWIIHELLGHLSKSGLQFRDCPIEPATFAALVTSTTQGLLSRPLARQILAQLFQSPHVSLTELIDKSLQKNKSGAVNSDPAAVAEQLANDVVREMPKEVKLIRQGNPRIVGKLIGEGMKRSQQRVDPQLLRKALEQLLKLDLQAPTVHDK